MHDIFLEISAVLVLAGAIGIVLHLLKQPPIVGYVITGLIVGPLGYMHLNNSEVLQSLSEIGITLLLFMVGLELTLKDLRQMGWVVGLVGVAQIFTMTALGAAIFGFFGFELRTALYLGLGIGVSSTIIAVKLLSEKRDLESLYGKLVLGILIVEDIISVLALALITGFGGGSVATLPAMLLVLGKLVVLFAIAIVASRHLFPKLVEKLSSSSDLIFLFSLAWGLGFATLISGKLFGLSPEIGGFLAGLTLANSSQHVHIASRMKPLRDFFLILFFIILGSQLVIADWKTVLMAGLGFTVLGVFIKPIFTFIYLTIMGFKGRTSFMTASSLGHISEFSIILAVLGWQAGHLNQTALSSMTFATILSFVAASYLLTHNQNIAAKWRGFLAWWDVKGKSREGNGHGRSFRHHIVLIGGDRTGRSILHALKDMHHRFLVIDFNPAIVRNLKDKNISVLFGDIADPEIQEEAAIDRAKLVISTVADYQDSLALINAVRGSEGRVKLIVSANNDWEAKQLYEKGADYVLMPNFLSGLQLAEMLEKDVTLKNLARWRTRDLELLGEKI